MPRYIVYCDNHDRSFMINMMEKNLYRDMKNTNYLVRKDLIFVSMATCGDA